jgi:butyrate kinase
MPVILFVLNPGSTSTKTALFRDAECLFGETVRHPPEELQQAGSLNAQLPIRLAAIEDALDRALADHGLQRSDLAAIVGRGGLLRSIPSGTYRVSPAMLADLSSARYGEHASNLGAPIADRLASPLKIPSFIVDPVSVDEFEPLARFSGSPRFRRKSIFHALNQKAIARQAADSIGKPYEQCSLIVAHLGGGISVGAHLDGRVVDVNNALEEGPFSPERTGTLPTLQLVDLCFSGEMDRAGIRKLINGNGGLFAYTGTTDCRAIEEQAATRQDYRILIEAMAYQVAKEIGAMSTVLSGRVDAVVLTGGLAFSQLVTGRIAARVAHLGPLLIYPGEDEMAALAGGARRVLEGLEASREYIREPIE